MTVVCIGKVTNKTSDGRFLRYYYFGLSACFFTILLILHPHTHTTTPPPPPHPILCPVAPGATKISENPSEFSRSRQPSAESLFKRSLKSRSVFTPGRLVCRRTILTGRVALSRYSAQTSANGRRGCSMFAAGWFIVYAVLPSVYFL